MYLECTGKWQKFNEAMCYLLIPEVDELDFHDAQGTCESFGGTLFEPLDQATNDLLSLKAYASGLFENSIWTGIVRALDEVTWVGQSSKTKPVFQPWKLSHPKSATSGANKVHLDVETRKWYSVKNIYKRGAACQKLR